MSGGSLLLLQIDVAVIAALHTWRPSRVRNGYAGYVGRQPGFPSIAGMVLHCHEPPLGVQEPKIPVREIVALFQARENLGVIRGGARNNPCRRFWHLAVVVAVCVGISSLALTFSGQGVWSQPQLFESSREET
jgi:hypothetical protein